MRTSAAIQQEARELALQLGMLRGEYLHRERQLVQRLDVLEDETKAALAVEAAQAPARIHERLAALEAAALTKGTT